MRYAKFNNSRSGKFPFFVYIKIGDGKITDPAGHNWAGYPKGAQEITQEEYEVVEKSYGENEPKVGDEVVVLEYVSVAKRYAKITIIEKGFATVQEKSGKHDRWMLRDIRKKSYIHKT